jgi:predicted transcriptional regulator
LLRQRFNVSDSAEAEQAEHIELAVDIIAAYVSNNSVPPSELPGLIGGIHAALNSLSASGSGSTTVVEKMSPAQIRKSITHDHIVSFEDGKPYPMTAASYSAQRSELARALGLGQQRRKSRGAAAAPVEEAPAPAAPKTRGRKKATAE